MHCSFMTKQDGRRDSYYTQEEINATLQNNSCTPNLEHAVFNIKVRENLEEIQITR